MNKNIIAITGEPGAGKDTVCNHLKDQLPNSNSFRFSDPLFDSLSMFCDEVTRKDQQWLVKKLRERFGENVLGQAIKRKIQKAEFRWILLNGMRKWSEFEMVKGLNGKVLYVTAEPKIRWQRLQERGEKDDDTDSYEEFLKKEKDSAEAQIPKIGKEADFKIKNNGSKKALKEQVEKAIEKLKK